jgi:hypothetical protein
MVIFGYHKHKQKTLKFAWQQFGTQSSLCVKINFNLVIRWSELDKINLHIIYNLQFFNNQRASCLWFMKHYQTKENWKTNVMPIYKISSSLIWSWFFSYIYIYMMHLLFKNAKNTLFWMKFHPKTLNLEVVLDLIHVYQYHTP